MKMRHLLILLATMFALFPMHAQNSQAPDFAFPEKVEADALRQLSRALERNDGDATVNALVKFGLAKSIVSADSIPTVLAKIEAVRNASQDVAVRSLLALLEAHIYVSVYDNDSYVINQRAPRAGEASMDFSVWSRRQFVARVGELTDAAMEQRDALLAIPLEQYPEVIDFERSMLTFYPTLYDFVVVQAVRCLEAFSETMSVLNPRLALNPLDTTFYPMSGGDVTGRILDAYRSLVIGREGSAPAIIALREEIEFIMPRMFEATETVPSFPSGRVERPTPGFEPLMKAYEANSGSPYAIELLLAINPDRLSVAEKERLYRLATDFAAQNKSYFNINGVENLINNIARKRVALSFPEQAAKGVPVKVKVRSTNVQSADVKVYDVTKLMAGKRDSYCRIPTPRPAAVQSVAVDFKGNIPFEAVREVELTLPSYGLYVIEAEFEGQQRANSSAPVVACSDISAGVFSGIGGSRIVAVNVGDGAPVEGVGMMFTPWSRSSAPSLLAEKTDASGVLTIDRSEAGTLRPRLGDDRYAQAVNYYRIDETGRKVTLRGELFTSLGLYRPGDKADFSLVAYESDNRTNNVASGKELDIVLRDANYQEVSRQTVTTDAWGRATGSFELPAEGLTGMFSLQMRQGDRQVDSKSFMVSDYKLPTFEVTVDNVVRPATPADSAVVKGRAATFAGFPVGEADVKMQLCVRSGSWFWATTSPVFFEAETVTGADGAFELTVPAHAIASSPAPGGYFMVTLSVTSPDGETHEASTGFNMGKPFTIQASVPATFIAGETQALVEVRDFNGEKRESEIGYDIVGVETPLFGDGEPQFFPVAKGTCMSGDVSALLSSLKGGVYTIRFTTVDPSLADEMIVDRVVVYNRNEKACPVNGLLWLPESDFTADESGEVTVPYGTALDNARVFVVVSDSRGRIASTRWEKPLRGMSTLRVKLPEATEPARIYMRIVSNLHSEAASVTVKPASSKRSIKLTTETFRDKVLPGSKETLHFKVTGNAGADAESAVILDMSNKAIDLLASNPLFFSPWSAGLRGLNVDGLYFGTTGTSLWGVYRQLDAAGVGEPSFRLYGLDFVSMVRMVREHKMMLASGVQIRGRANMKAEAAVTFNATDSAIEEDAAVEDAGTLSEPQAAAGAAGEATAEGGDPTHCPSEIPLAFFRPMLVTAPDGSLEITYTVPDANTTWVLRALAYNRAFDTATDKVEIVSSKPLMVSANATRFLRTSDRIELKASVMNATDSLMVARTVCEVLDASDMRVLASAESTDTIAAGARAVAGVAFEAPADAQAVIYRVKSTAGDFTDGEQTLIPILPSEQDVVESQMFYLAPGQNSFSMQIPAVGNGRAYLKYTENPAWEVVSALPGLREGTIDSSLDAAAALFSAAVADGLMRQYPEIARTLRKWRENPSDSALTSMLEKNEELKSVLLSSTPWVADALSQTERMQRLVLLLDSRNTSKVIERSIASLARMTASEGGWCWTSSYPEVSEWCTTQILDMLGDLNRMGWLPADKRLESMTSKALAYIDRETASEFRKYPKNDFTSYCYMRGKFPGVKQSSAAAKVTAGMVQRIIASWKNHSVVMKAADALILNNNGYNATARSILESLRQFATVTPEKGMWWQQLENTWFMSLDKVGCTAIVLDAFAAVDPGNEAIDKIRQWLVLEKTNTDWGNAIITSQVIASILTSGKEWTVNPAGTAIHIGDTLITPDREEHATGAFTEQITSLVGSATTFTVDRRADYPSYGAVVTMRRAAMDEIKGVGCSELKVAKSMSVFDGNEWVASDEFKVGDRVRVTLELRADTDMDYVVIQDLRAAALEPVEQLPEPVWSEGLCFYRENRDSQTNFFIRRMPRGVYLLTYELFATQSGTFASGVAQAQSQYNPAIAAHSAGMEVTVK